MSKIERNKIKLKTVKLTKLSDDKFEGKHPNNINEGFTTTGLLLGSPIVGYSCSVGHIRTSTVTEILEDGVFKTENSTYKIEEI